MKESTDYYGTEPTLLTYCLFTYNQEAYVAEAVASALAQTYEPLEIIISDDCSRDGTFAVVRRSIEFYRGPHTVILNRNHQNLGIGAHVSKVLAMAKGELCIMAAGDDISFPIRSARILEAWDQQGRRPAAIVSNAYVIDNDVVTNKTWYSKKKPHYPRNLHDYIRGGASQLGCTTAYAREAVCKLPALPSEIIAEDQAYVMRVVCCGGYCFIDEPLVYYRRHDSNTSVKSNIISIATKPRGTRYLTHLARLYELWRADLMALNCSWAIDRLKLNNKVATARAELKMAQSKRIGALKILLSIALKGHCSFKTFSRLFIAYVLRVYKNNS